MKNNYHFLLLFFCFQMYSQVGINTTTPYAQLDIKSSNQATPSNTDGVLIPKIDTFPVTNPTATQQGMLVYLTTTVGLKLPGFYYWDNPTLTWVGINSSKCWELQGNSVTNPAVNFIGTTDNNDVVFKRFNQFAGLIGETNTSFGATIFNFTNTLFGSYNSAFGSNSLSSYNSGNNNTAVGSYNLFNNGSGSDNIAMGVLSLSNNDSGNSNVAVGNLTLSNSNGDFNIAIGDKAQADNIDTNTSNTIAIGYRAFADDNSLVIGNEALSGIECIAIGNRSYAGNYSTVIGYESSTINDGSNNTTLGYHTLFQSNVDDTTAIGANALSSINTGNKNTALGSNTLVNNLTGSENIAVGVESLYFNSTGNGNVAIGNLSLTHSNGNFNTAIGHFAQRDNPINSISNTIAIGYKSISYDNSLVIGNEAFSGIESISIGNKSSAIGFSNTTVGYESSTLSGGSNNTAIGYQSLFYSNADDNTAIGSRALSSNLSGNNNTALGSNALNFLLFGNNNTAIGYNAQVPLAFGNDQIRLGDTNINYAGIQVPWTITSDRRLKFNIQNSNLGLDFINQLNPVSYFRKNDETKKVEYGFIAQELEETLKTLGVSNVGLISKDDKGMYSVRYNDLIAPMVKAIQEQQIIITSLEEKLLLLEKKFEMLEKNKSN
jgi:hypothetical protein